MQFQACAYCDHPNPVGTNYCSDCGAALHLKPCRQCGAVAVAKTRHCPACKAEFPVRPTINVDGPWAFPGSNPTSNALSAGAALPQVRSVSASASDAERLSAATRAFAATQELIEKAGTGAMPKPAWGELRLPRQSVDDAGRAGRS